MKYIKIFEAFKKSDILSRIKYIDNYKSFRRDLISTLGNKTLLSELNDDHIEYLTKREYKDIIGNVGYSFFFNVNKYIGYCNNKLSDWSSRDFDYCLYIKTSESDLIQRDEFKNKREMLKSVRLSNKELSKQNFDRYINILSDRYPDDIKAIKKILSTIKLELSYPTIINLEESISEIVISLINDDEQRTDYGDLIKNDLKLKTSLLFKEKTLKSLIHKYYPSASDISIDEFDSTYNELNTLIFNKIKQINLDKDDFIYEVYKIYKVLTNISYSKNLLQLYKFSALNDKDANYAHEIFVFLDTRERILSNMKIAVKFLRKLL